MAGIRRTRPQVIITYNDDQQGYPHPDHLKVHDISGPAFERAGDPAWYPEAGEPWQPLKLYYTVWSRRRLLAVHEALLRLRGSSPFDEKWFERPDQDGRITTQIPVADYLWARTGSLRAHATQVDPSEPFWFGLSDEELSGAYPYEDWILARSLVGGPPEPGRSRTTCSPAYASGCPAVTGAAAASRGPSAGTVQYRIVLGKKEEIVVGPDDADVGHHHRQGRLRPRSRRGLHAGAVEGGRAHRRAVRRAPLGRRGARSSGPTPDGRFEAGPARQAELRAGAPGA